MTDKEAAEVLERLAWGGGEPVTAEMRVFAYQRAIARLEAPSGDAVSREAVLDLVRGLYEAMTGKQASPALLGPFRALPSVLTVDEVKR